MKRERVHCPTCHHEVELVVTTTPDHETQASVADGLTVCTDFRDRCSTGTCPLCGVPGLVMGVRLARSELRTEGWSTVQAHCAGCDDRRELLILSASDAVCPVCKTLNRWDQPAADPELLALAGAE